MLITNQPNPPVVVGVDGSEAGSRALDWAGKLATTRSWPLRLVHADSRLGEPGVHLLSAIAAARPASSARRIPIRQAAARWRIGGRGSRALHMWRVRTWPNSSRSAATRPPTVVITNDRSRRLRATARVSVRAATTPRRSGPIHISTSSGPSGSGNVSATGPGPSTGPDATAHAPTAVTGRLCSRNRRPAPSNAHSTSCGRPNARRARSASRASASNSRW